MSQYYKINNLKVRVSDHEPNDKLNGGSDIELYVRSADNCLLSIENQIESICEKRGYEMADFQEVINDWKDGSYDKDFFVVKSEEVENASSSDTLAELRAAAVASNDDKLKGHALSRFAKHAEIKALSELTGVSQSYIKKHFNVR